MGQEVGTAEGRKAFVQASSSSQTSTGVSSHPHSSHKHTILKRTQFDHDFVFNVAKKATDARKQVFEGIAKGLEKVVKNHS